MLKLSLSAVLAGICASLLSAGPNAQACCAVAPPGRSVVNADQTVILIWDQEQQTEHFIRQASFRGEGESVGFIVPTPSRPQLEESGNAGFPFLNQITAPSGGKSIVMPLSCSARPQVAVGRSVRVIERKQVAGFDAVVLSADSGQALVQWLKQHDYAYTEEAAEWARPYLAQHWYMTAMKIADKRGQHPGKLGLNASALRISFHTDRPLFPYREPDARRDAFKLDVRDRLLRIHFIAASRAEGRFPSGAEWKADTTWSAPLTATQRTTLLHYLALPATTGPSQYWLTTFDHHWPYGKAPGDVYFQSCATQQRITKAEGATDLSLPLLALGTVFVRKRRAQRDRASAA